jgi:hypothetical protein
MDRLNQKSISSFLFIIATITIVAISNSIVSYAQTNSTFSNQTTTSNSSNNPAVKSIDAAISSLKSGDKAAGKKSLLQAESDLEDNSKVVDAEKHVEASLQALKDDDTNGAINHAELAKKSLLGQ